MAITNTTKTFASVTLTRNEVWQSNRPYLASWDGVPADDEDGIQIPAGKLMLFYNGDVIRVRSTTKDAKIVRMPRP